eukprot:GHVS01075395.1.p1 GENE.GHVS01075395.1~~GHVS01075395.1.p1  ORF type:complete len:476 (+),score=66.37 GHVS01075395.1:45-1472(+)
MNNNFNCLLHTNLRNSVLYCLTLCRWCVSCSSGSSICEQQQEHTRDKTKTLIPSTTTTAKDNIISSHTIAYSSSYANSTTTTPPSGGDFTCSTGFVREENSLLFYPTRDLLFEEHPPQSYICGKIFIAKDYFRKKNLNNSELKVVKKYSTVTSHRYLLSSLLQSHSLGHPFPLYEIIVEQQPRVLYFDIDGPISEKQSHRNIVNDISEIISAAFKLSVPLRPTVLLSDTNQKYSSHILFPQLQFCNQSEQSLCIPLLFRLISTRCPKLAALVDTKPYSSFQAFRAPFAVKLKHPTTTTTTASKSNATTIAGRGVLLIDKLFSDDPLTTFSTYLNPSYSAIPPSVRTADVILNNSAVIYLRTKNEFKQINTNRSQPVESTGRYLDIYADEFVIKDEKARTVFYSSEDWVLSYERLLPLLHPSRCSHFGSWFRLARITYSLLAFDAIQSPDLQRRVWSSWFGWSSVRTPISCFLTCL